MSCDPSNKADPDNSPPSAILRGVLSTSADPIDPVIVAVIVMSEVPLNAAEPDRSPPKAMFRLVWSAVAVEALPVNAAVIVLATKFPETSRETIVDGVFSAVAFEVIVTAAASPVPDADMPTPEVPTVAT
jgi:hypothetical protein